MDRTDAVAWVLSRCSASLLKSQARTLSTLVAAAVLVERVSLAALGRAMLGTTKHQIKRAYRFLANGRVEPVEVMRGVVGRLLRGWPDGRPLVVALDWTDVRGLQTLMAAAVIGGRAIPLCWASCTKHTYDGPRSRNAFEEALLLALRDMVPRHIRVVVLADRGFGRTELGRSCQRMGLSYVVRIQPRVWMAYGRVRCRLDRYPVRRGDARLLKGVVYRRHDPVTQHVAVHWKMGQPEPWYLMTDLPLPAKKLTGLYAKRTTVEELFRDHKSRRNGWSLRDTGIRRADRLDRLLLILALAYLRLVGVGLVATERCRPSAWASNNRENQLSLFQIGRVMLPTLRTTGKAAFLAVVAALQAAGENWG